MLVAGRSSNGAEAWFDVGGFQLQPSEFAKVTLILMLASYLGAHVEPDGGLPFHRFVVALLLDVRAGRARSSPSPTSGRRR